MCGDGVEEGDEVCDDGNTVSGDGCNSTCTLQDSWDFVAAHYTEQDQNEPAVACSESLVAAAWTDWGVADGDGASVRLRYFGPDGMPLEIATGDDLEQSANGVTIGHQHQPDVAITPSGRVVVVWTDTSSASQDAGTDPGDIRMGLFEQDGEQHGSEILVNTTISGDQQTPAVAVCGDGVILVVWADSSGVSDPSSYGIRGRLFDEDGTALVNAQTADTGDFQVNLTTAGVQRDPALCPTGTGSFLVSWTDGSGAWDASGYGIVGVLLDAEGAVDGPGTELLINSTTNANQIAPAAVLQPGLGPAVAWTDYSLTDDLSESGIRARLLDADGNFRTNHTDGDEDFPINWTTEAAQELSRLASGPEGQLLFVWQDWGAVDGSSASIRGIATQADGTPKAFELSPTGADFPVNTTIIGGQHSPVVCSVSAWYLALWTDESEKPPDDGGDAVRYRLLPGF